MGLSRLVRRAVVGGAAVLVVVAAISCDRPGIDPRFACTQVAVPGLNITIVDSASGQSTLFTGLWARARAGVYVDSVALDLGDHVKGPVTVPLAYEHKGTYDVAVHADGYQMWFKSGVVVGADECHVTTVELTARLTP